MIAYDDFRNEVVKVYRANYGCGAKMSDDDVAKEFDITIGRDGYAEFERVEKLHQKRNEAFNPVKSACDQIDMFI